MLNNPAQNQKPFSILLADDRTDANNPGLLINSQECTILFTNCQVHAATVTNQQKFDLIFISQNFTNNLITLLKNSPHNLNFSTPTLALITTSDLLQRKSLIQAGYDDYIKLPLSADKLNEIISLWRHNDDLARILYAVDTLLLKLNNNHKLVLTLWQKLFEELPLQLLDIENNLKNQKFEKAGFIVHKLNGSAKICGLSAIEGSGIDLENCLLAHNFQNASDYYKQLHKQVMDLLSWQPQILDRLQHQSFSCVQ
jgi:HPt (histidine-containing phosphotransfer) domain-containing protein